MRLSTTVESKPSKKQYQAIFAAMGVQMEDAVCSNAGWTQRWSTKMLPPVDKYSCSTAEVEVSFYHKTGELVIRDYRVK